MATIEQRPTPPEVAIGRASLPEIDLPRAPEAGRLWSRAVGFAAVVFALFLLDSLTNLLMQYWFLESIGFKSVFWTNFKSGLVLFLFAAVLYGGAVIVPTITSGLAGRARRRMIQFGLLAGVW